MAPFSSFQYKNTPSFYHSKAISTLTSRYHPLGHRPVSPNSTEPKTPELAIPLGKKKAYSGIDDGVVCGCRLSYTQDQEPPGYLQHIDIHLKGLTASPGHTDEQTQVAIQVDGVIAKMINDLTQVRKDAIQLAKLSNAQLRQPDTLTLLNDMATLTNEANSGWFDTTTHKNVGGAIWLNMRIQQLATISLETSS